MTVALLSLNQDTLTNQCPTESTGKTLINKPIYHIGGDLIFVVIPTPRKYRTSDEVGIVGLISDRV